MKIQKKSLIALSILSLSALLVGCGPSGEISEKSKIREGLTEGGPASTNTVEGDWTSTCRSNSEVSMGVLSVVKIYRFGGNVFQENTKQYSDLHCSSSKLVGEEISTGTFALSTSGKKIKFTHGNRIISLKSREQASLYNTYEICGISDWRSDSVARDVSRAACTAQLNQAAPFEIGLVDRRENSFHGMNIRACYTGPTGFPVCDELSLKRTSGAFPSSQMMGEVDEATESESEIEN